MTLIRGFIAIVLVAGLALAAAPPATWYVDDEQFSKDFSTKLTAMAKKNEMLRASELRKRLKPKRCRLDLAPRLDQPLSPEAVYERTLPSVFVVGSVARTGNGGKTWEEGTQASAFALSADGVLVTNWHVFEKLDRERFGAANHKGEVFPLVDVLAGDPVADVIIIKVKGEGFRPLPLGDEPNVGSWASVLSHPGGHLFSYTQGHITRYNRDHIDEKPVDWMVLSADFAVGSSGGPVLDRCGNVVGMAAATVTIEADEEEPEKPKTRRRVQEPPAKAPDAKAAEKMKPQVQMVIKQAVPARVIRQLVQENVVK